MATKKEKEMQERQSALKATKIGDLRGRIAELNKEHGLEISTKGTKEELIKRIMAAEFISKKDLAALKKAAAARKAAAVDTAAGNASKAAEASKGPAASNIVSPEVIAQAAACKTAIEEAAHNIDDSFCELAARLHEASTNNYAIHWGVASFREFVEGPLAIGYRKACYLVEIHQALQIAGIARDRAITIGWTKLGLIAKKLIAECKNKTAVEALLRIAETSTTKEVQEAVRTSIPGSSGTEAFEKLSLKFPQANWSVVESALDHARASVDSDSPEVCVEHICSTYLTASAGSEAMSLDDALSVVERTYGVTINRTAIVQMGTGGSKNKGKQTTAASTKAANAGVPSDNPLDVLTQAGAGTGTPAAAASTPAANSGNSTGVDDDVAALLNMG